MAASERYAFGDFVLERSQQRVLHRDGTPLILTPRLFSALSLFVERPGELLDKDTLILALWPDLVVEENNLSQVISSLRRALGDDPQDSRYIQTMPRRGFRFVAPVTLLPDQAAGVPSPSRTDPDPSHHAETAARRRWLQWVLAGSSAVGLAGAGWWFGRAPTRSSGAVRATLAVLPFKSLVTDGRDELLEVGMADSLIANLSGVPGLVVRSVGSVRRYAGPDQDPLRAARELDVAWVVDGSLQRRGDQLHVTARLLSAADGVAAWSGSFDEQSRAVFDLQDAIAQRIARVLAPTLDASAGAALPLKPVGETRDPTPISSTWLHASTPRAFAPRACARAWSSTTRRSTSTPAMHAPMRAWSRLIGA